MNVRVVHNLDWVFAARLGTTTGRLRRWESHIPRSHIGISADAQECGTKSLGRSRADGNLANVCGDDGTFEGNGAIANIIRLDLGPW